MMKKVIILSIICILLILGGFIWGIYDYASRHNISYTEVINTINNYLKPQPKPIIKPPNTVVKPPEPPKPPQPVIAQPKPPEPPKPSMSEESARQILDDAEMNYKQFDFDDATDKLKKVIRANPSPILTMQAAELNRKCDIFNRLLKNIPRENMRDGNELVEIQFNTGQPIIAKMIEEGKTSITVKQDGIEKEIPLREINRYIKLTPEAYQGKLRSEYQKRLGRLTKPTAQDYYQLATYCYKKQLNPESLSMLELAWEKDEQFLASLSGKPSEPPIVPSQPMDAKKQLALAEEYYNKGKEHMEKTYDKGPDFDDENQRARDAFRASLDIYTQLREINPEDKDIEAKITDIEYYLVCIRKQSRTKSK